MGLGPYNRLFLAKWGSAVDKEEKHKLFDA